MINALKKQVFMRSSGVYAPNTFLGNLGEFAPTRSHLSDLLSLPIQIIKNFKIDADNNISCHITQNYTLSVSRGDYGFNRVFYRNELITYFWDIEGRVETSFGWTFERCTSMVSVIMPGWKGSSGLISEANFYRAAKLTHLHIPNADFLINNIFFETQPRLLYFKNNVLIDRSFTTIRLLKRLYIGNAIIPNTANSGQPAFNNLPLNVVIYCHPDMLTSNAGAMQAGLLYAQNSRSANVRAVLNKTKPGAITNLTVTKTSTTATFNFTAPTSSNAIDFHEIWIKEVDGKYNAVDEFMPNQQEITAAGQSITGLKPDTEYEVFLCTCDIYWNGTGMNENPSKSNTITFKTLA